MEVTPRNWWRVSRYDPAQYAGRRFPTTWTSISDVGRQFDGAVLSLREYEEVEAAYVETIAEFLARNGVERLCVSDLEAGDGLREGQEVGAEAWKAIVSTMLREEAVCRLVEPSKAFAIEVGFDLVAFVGADVGIAREPDPSGLIFIEQCAAAPFDRPDYRLS